MFRINYAIFKLRKGKRTEKKEKRDKGTRDRGQAIHFEIHFAIHLAIHFKLRFEPHLFTLKLT
jgi:hypothetical protein